MIDLVGLAVLLAVVVLVIWRRSGWEAEARKWARRYDIELPASAATRVAHLLRRQYRLGMLAMFPLMALARPVISRLDEHTNAHSKATAYSATVIVLPLVAIAIGFVQTIPSRTSKGAAQVPLPARPTPWQMFTRHESIALAAGTALTLIGIAWGMWRIEAGGWWIAWPAALAVTAFAWWRAAHAIFDRPAYGRDPIEFGWDVLMRYQRTRELTIGTVFAPAVSVVLIDVALTSTGSLIQLSALAIVGYFVWRVFHEGRGLWRQFWDLPGNC